MSSSIPLDWIEGESGPWLVLPVQAAASWLGEQGDDQRRACEASDGCDDQVPAALIDVGGSSALVLSDVVAGDVMPTAWWVEGDDVVILRLLTSGADEDVLGAVSRTELRRTDMTLDLGDEILLLEAWETERDLPAGYEDARIRACRPGCYHVHVGSSFGDDAELLIVRLVFGDTKPQHSM